MGGGGAGHPDPEISGGPVSKKNFFGPWGFILVENKGGRVPWAPPLDQPLGEKHKLCQGAYRTSRTLLLNTCTFNSNVSEQVARFCCPF